MSISVYLAFLAACVLVVIVPGPTVTLIVANSLRHGRRAGMLNVFGTQIGLALTLGAVLLGLASLIAAMGSWFVWLRLAGAVYLMWLGWKLIFASGTFEASGVRKAPRGGFLLQGLAVALSNPKTLLFFGAFFPQFMDANRDFTLQVLIMGGTAMAVASVSDTAYVLLASRAGASLSRPRMRMMTRTTGGMLMGGGLWLALSGSK